ncbi:hypothetical protein D3C87_1461830 [compost metagenome]
MLFGKGHVGEYVLLGIIHETGELRHLWPDLVGDIAPLGTCSFWRVLSKSRGDEGRHDPPSALSGMGQGIAHEMNPAALPGGGQYLRYGGLDALMRIGDGELDAAQSPPGQLSKKLGPDRLGFGRADFHAEHLASAVGVDADGDDDGDRDDATAAPDLEVGGIDPEVGPFAFDGPVEEGLHLLVDLLAQPG